MYRVIFEHHLKTGQEEAFIKQWQAGSDIIQSYPGAKGTLLYRSIDKPSVLYAMADWESLEARENAMSSIAKRDDADFILKAHEQYVSSYETIVSATLLASSFAKD